MENNEIEIPFGAKDSELIEATYHIPDGMEAIIEGNKVIIRKKESEDERIKKDIVSFLRSKNGYMTPNEDWNFHNRWLPWLEKQSKENMIEALRLEYEKGKADALSEQRKEWTSEDLLNRNEIMDILQEYNRDDLINWLEKQGNDAYLQEKIESFTNAHKGEDPEGIIAACRGDEEQGEHKPANEPKFKVGDTIRLKNSLAEFTIESISNGRYYFKGCSIDIIACDRDYYKLAVPKLSSVESIGENWNEDDKRIIEEIKFAVMQMPSQREDTRQRCLIWLEKLGQVKKAAISQHENATSKENDNSSTNVEWGEGDKIKINRIVGFIENLDIPDNDILRKDAAWLKSLKERLKRDKL